MGTPLRWTALLLCLAGWSAPARAYEDHASVAVGAGPRLLWRGELPRVGTALSLSAGRGLDPAWAVRGRLTAVRAWSTAAPPAAQLFGAGGEAVYMLDILTWVPYAGLGVEARVRVQQGEAHLGAGAYGLVGVDYLFDRYWIWGLQLRGGVAAAGPGGAWGEFGANLVLRHLVEIW